MKVLKFLNKHYNIEYDVFNNKWGVKQSFELDDFKRQRVKSFDDREEHKEDSNTELNKALLSTSCNDLPTQICQILNIIYEAKEPKKPNRQETSIHQQKKNSIEEYKMFCK